jgi:hypothetical protein
MESHLCVAAQVHEPLIAGCLSLFATLEQSRSQVFVAAFQLNELLQVHAPLNAADDAELATFEQLMIQEAVSAFQT